MNTHKDTYKPIWYITEKKKRLKIVRHLVITISFLHSWVPGHMELQRETLSQNQSNKKLELVQWFKEHWLLSQRTWVWFLAPPWLTHNQPPVIPVPSGNLMPSSGLHGHYIHMVCIHTCRKTFIHIENNKYTLKKSMQNKAKDGWTGL